MSPQSVHAFAEKVALITDGAGRIGKAAALQLALQGCYVIVGYSNISPAEESAINELKALGTLAGGVQADISTAEGAKNLVKAVQNMYGRLDLLVNCMKLVPDPTFETTSDETFTRTVDANIRSAFFVTQAALELMKDRPKPRIVNVTSACDTAETAGNAAFSVAQAGLAGLTRSLAGSLPAKFRVNCVAVSEKARHSSGTEDDLFKRDKGVPADDVARVILYLLSGEAVGLNGQILTVE